MSSMSVPPPCSQRPTWWAWHQLGETAQPTQLAAGADQLIVLAWHQLGETAQPTQPLSRAASTERWCLVACRRPRPSHSGRLFWSKMAGTMLASHAGRSSSSASSPLRSLT